MGLEVAVGILIAWAVRKAKRAGKQLDGVADEVVDVGAAKVRNLILGKLGTDPSVTRLEKEAAETGEVSERTQTRIRLALEDAVDEDKPFGAALESALLAHTETIQSPGGVATASSGGIAATGTAASSGDGSTAIGAIGSVAGNLSIGGQPADPQ